MGTCFRVEVAILFRTGEHMGKINTKTKYRNFRKATEEKTNKEQPLFKNKETFEKTKKTFKHEDR